MLYWRIKRIDTLISHEIEITMRITDGHMHRDEAMILLLFFQQRGVSFKKQAFSLSAVG